MVIGFVSICASSYLKNYCSYVFHNVKSASMHAYIREYANQILCGLIYILTLVYNEGIMSYNCNFKYVIIIIIAIFNR